jgi:hypothetical protein
MLYPRSKAFGSSAEEIKWFKDKKATETDHRNEVQLGLRLTFISLRARLLTGRLG